MLLLLSASRHRLFNCIQIDPLLMSFYALLDKANFMSCLSKMKRSFKSNKPPGFNNLKTK